MANQIPIPVLKPGPLSASDAAALNRSLSQLSKLANMEVVHPLSFSTSYSGSVLTWTGQDVRIVEVTNATADGDGRYAGQVQRPDDGSSGPAYVDLEECRVVDVNGEPLALGYYLAVLGTRHTISGTSYAVYFTQALQSTITSGTVNYNSTTINVQSSSTLNVSSSTVNFTAATVNVNSATAWTFNNHVSFGGYYCLDVYRASTAVDLNNETLHTEPWWIITPTASGVELTGIDSSSAGDGCFLWITNGSQTQTLTIPNESLSSTAANSFLCPEGKDVVLGYDESVPVMRDDTDSRWRVLDQIPSAYVRDVTIYSGSWIFQSSSSITFQVSPKFEKPICEEITEKAVTGTENDLDLGGPTPRYMLTPTGSTTITGIDSSDYSDGESIKLHNTSGVQEIEITNEGAGSSADNRIRTPGASTYEIPAYGGVELMCRDSSGTKRWYVVADEQAAGGGSGAPTGAQYVTLATDATLTNERVLTGTLHQITVTDGGAGSTVTLSTPQDLATTSDVAFAKVGIGKTPGQGLDIADSEDIGFGTVTGTKIGTATNQMLAFYGSSPVDQPAAITSALVPITHTAPGTEDYAIQSLTNSSPYGFVTQDEGHSTLKAIANLQARVDDLEARLQELGLIA